MLNTFRLVIKELTQSAHEMPQCSMVYQSESWGFQSPHLFLNQVCILQTWLEPSEMMKYLLDIEKKFGRNRGEQTETYHSRTLDLDILFVNEEIIDKPGLQVPHPRLHQRNFSLVPLFEIMPNFRHPVLNKTIAELYKNSTDKSIITPIG